jgi:hypothetical protein
MTSPLKRLLIEYDSAYANSILQYDIVKVIAEGRTQDRAHGVSDEFMYLIQHALENNKQRYEYKIMLILIWMGLNTPFRTKLLQNEVHAAQLTDKLQEMLDRHAVGKRLDDVAFERGGKEIAHHQRTTGHFVYTFRNVYLSQC